MEKMNVASEATEAFGSAPLDDPTAVQIRKSGETYYFFRAHIFYGWVCRLALLLPQTKLLSVLSQHLLTTKDGSSSAGENTHFLHSCNKSKTCEHSPAHCK